MIQKRMPQLILFLAFIAWPEQCIGYVAVCQGFDTSGRERCSGVRPGSSLGSRSVSLLQSGPASRQKVEIYEESGRGASIDPVWPAATMTVSPAADRLHSGFRAALAWVDFGAQPQAQTVLLAASGLMSRAASLRRSSIIVPIASRDLCEGVSILLFITVAGLVAVCSVRCLLDWSPALSGLQHHDSGVQPATLGTRPAAYLGTEDVINDVVKCASESTHPPSETRRPSAASSLPAASAASARSDGPPAYRPGYLAPQLAAPKEQERVLFLPLQPLSHRALDITDERGHVVACVRPHLGSTWPVFRRPSLGQWAAPTQIAEGCRTLFCFSLSTAGGKELAQCRCQEPPGQDPEFHILDSARALCAKLKLCQRTQSYLLDSSAWGRLHFSGNLPGRRVKIETDGGDLIGETEAVPGASSTGCVGVYKLWGSPGADLGLLVCALFCLDHAARKHLSSEQGAILIPASSTR